MDMAGTQVCTRLAPSPTGALHLGNARTFLINHALAVQHGWRVRLRIEDLDTPRTKFGADIAAIEDLQWLGIGWHGAPSYQKTPQLSRYEKALQSLASRGLIYPCPASRSQVERAAVTLPEMSHDPNDTACTIDDEHEQRYPQISRPAAPLPVAWPDGRLDELAAVGDAQHQHDVAWRLRLRDEPVEFEDMLLGRCVQNVYRTTGDYVVVTKHGLPAYQLAVVVDDMLGQVTHIVRGQDLLSSTARQQWLYRYLAAGQSPTYVHVPLVRGDDGRKLAKRHGDTRLAYYRELGVPVVAVIGLLGEWCAMGKRRLMSTAEFVEHFDLNRLPRTDIIFTQEDDTWLKSQIAE